ncbi:hypothetical protein [Streptomyces sp. ME109]|uniref:hypothetical protein n=1 Tax=Streptomyces sp. me109 TaxID=1827853 RepID=UPI0021C8992A|nr:hypothetical protein [Streptomyces sp. me109]
MLGPVTELPMRFAAKVYGDAGLTHVSSTTGQQDYFVTSPVSSFQTGVAHAALGGWFALPALITKWPGRIGVVLDRSGGTTIQDQATLLVQQWRDAPGGRTVPRVVAETSGDGPAAIRSLLAAGVTAFAHLGPLDATVAAAGQLSAARFSGPRWMQHLLYGTDFPSRAGAAGEGWYVVDSAVDPPCSPRRRHGSSRPRGANDSGPRRSRTPPRPVRGPGSPCWSRGPTPTNSTASA